MGSVIITSIIAFTAIILLLVFILLFAQSKLVNSGDVKIIINGDSVFRCRTAIGKWNIFRCIEDSGNIMC